MLIKHLVVCTQSLSHIHPQLYILFPPKLWEQCHQALTFAFVRYTFCFCGTGLRMFFSAPLVFPCLREKLHNMVWGKKKVSFMEREGGAFPLWSKSADLLYLRKKMKQLYWKQMLTLCRLLKMERVLSVVAVTKRYWWQSRSLWCVTFPAGEDSRSSMRPKMKSACDFNVQETPRTKLVCCIFFPCRMHNIYLSCNIKAGKTS